MRRSASRLCFVGSDELSIVEAEQLLWRSVEVAREARAIANEWLARNTNETTDEARLPLRIVRSIGPYAGKRVAVHTGVP